MDHLNFEVHGDYMPLALIFVRVLLRVLLSHPLHILKWASVCLVSQRICAGARVFQPAHSHETKCLPP